MKRPIPVARHMSVCCSGYVEKHRALKAGAPCQKLKRRILFQGNYLRDQNCDVAIFQDRRSSLATMDAARVADWHGGFLSSVSPGRPQGYYDMDCFAQRGVAEVLVQQGRVV